MKRLILTFMLCLLASPAFGQVVPPYVHDPLDLSQLRIGQLGHLPPTTTTTSLTMGVLPFLLVFDRVDPNGDLIVRPASMKRTRRAGTGTTLTNSGRINLLLGPPIRLRNVPTFVVVTTTITSNGRVVFQGTTVTINPQFVYRVADTELTPVVDVRGRSRGNVRTFILDFVGTGIIVP